MVKEDDNEYDKGDEEGDEEDDGKEEMFRVVRIRRTMRICG